MEATEKKLKGHRFRDLTFQNILTEFLTTSSDTIKALRNKFTIFIQTWLDTLVYFAEDPSEHYNVVTDHNDPSKDAKKPPTYIFVSLDLFFQTFKDSVSNARAQMERNKNKVRSESEKLKKQALLNSASSLSASSLDSTPNGSDSNLSLASTPMVKKGGNSDEVFEEAELDKVRKKMANRMSTHFGEKPIIIDAKSRGKTDRILADAAAPAAGLEDPEFIIRRRSILANQSKRKLTLDRKLKDVRKSINLKNFKFEELS
jgi:hypothetical protein